jgi:hypothetical protein
MQAMKERDDKQLLPDFVQIDDVNCLVSNEEEKKVETHRTNTDYCSGNIK